MADLLPVAFHGDTLYLVEHNGEPFTAVKPICEAIGLDWTAQHAKITSMGWRWNCSEATIVAADGKQRSMTCLPLRKLSGWLANISAAKVRPEIRDKLIAYQEECDGALWRYWTEGHARRPGAPAPAGPRQAAADRAELICRDGGQFMTRPACTRFNRPACSAIWSMNRSTLARKPPPRSTTPPRRLRSTPSTVSKPPNGRLIMCNPGRTAWHTVVDLLDLVDTAHGLTLLAAYDCATDLLIPAERDAAEQAPVRAARILLAQAKALLDDLEPVVRELEREAA